MRGRLVTAAVTAACLLAAGAGVARAQVQPYGTNDYGGFHNVLPPGTNGLANLGQIAWFLLTGQRPPHNDDQLGMYSSLATAAPNITDPQIGDFFKDATFGVRSSDVETTESPEPGVTIVRDKGFGVPHIYGDTRPALMFGIGYATAEDRLFFIDALRHAGRGELASFAGGANASMDEGVWASEPYTEQDFTNQVNFGLLHAPGGQQIYQDATNYVAGINAYIAAATNPLNPRAGAMLPGEYIVLGKTPQPFTLEDLVSIGTLVGGIFGQGGGQQLRNAVLYERLEQEFGPEHANVPGSPELVSHGHARGADHSGFGTFLSFDDPNDPEAPTTVHGRRFPYQTLPMPSTSVLQRIALPDPGTVHWVNPVVAGGLPGGAAASARAASGRATRVASARATRVASARATRRARRSPIGLGLGARANAGPALLSFPRTMSNAVLVSAADSASGHPLAVMGPQTGYFSPEILVEEDIHGPGIDADGAAFAGTNMYVQLGHGQDYAWSATSSDQNVIDTFAVPLCNPDGGPVSIDSGDYLLGRQCVAMETLTRSESWQANLADPTPSGSVTFRTQRTGYGLVIARATIGGRPVVYTNLRSTYMHELDPASGFALYDNPAAMRTPRDFMNAAYRIGYTFNWFYTNSKHIAYVNSGLNPVRAPDTDPLFPTWSAYTWAGLHPAAQTTPSSLTEQQTPESAHPQVVDQSYLTSWNNKQAPGYNNAATAQEYASVYRSQLLDNNLNGYLRLRHRKLTLADAINAMGNAGTQDLRGVEVLPYALQVIGHPTDPGLAAAVTALSDWVASGAHRINREHPGASGLYDQAGAVRIMDAWWPLLVKAEFQPVLGTATLGQVEGEFAINDEPGHGTSGPHLGSAFDVGFYGIVQKDLRSVLGLPVRGPLNRIYCGGGSLAACRTVLESSLAQAAAESFAQVYPADGVCRAGDQMCSDSIQFRAIGAITEPLIEWINRPTFQQADEIQGHAPGP